MSAARRTRRAETPVSTLRLVFPPALTPSPEYPPLVSVRLVREPGMDERPEVRTPADVAAVLRPLIGELDREAFAVVLLDTRGRLIAVNIAHIGGIDAAVVEPAMVFKVAIHANARSVIVAHNHPSGNPEPSGADLSITKKLVEAGKLLGVPVHDHLIIAGAGHTSLAERGLM